MTHTTGLVRGSLVISKIFIEFNKLHRDVKENRSDTSLDLEKNRKIDTNFY